MLFTTAESTTWVGKIVKDFSVNMEKILDSQAVLVLKFSQAKFVTPTTKQKGDECMKLVDRPPKTCYNQNRRMKFPKRSLALFLVFALLFGTNGSYSAQEDDRPIVVEFEPVKTLISLK